MRTPGKSPYKIEGPSCIEILLILVLVAIVVVVILTTLGPTIGNIFSNVTPAHP